MGIVLRVVVALTGASGAIYGYRLLEKLHEAKVELIIIASDVALEILKRETGINGKVLSRFGKVYRDSDMMGPTASGSYMFDAMVVVPCSMKTLACVANGVSSSLITRTADVVLKERRRLVLVTRETPLSLVHIRNMLGATEAGAVVLPACPGFYHRPRTLEGLVDYIVGKVLDQLGIKHNLFRRWGEST